MKRFFTAFFATLLFSFAGFSLQAATTPLFPGGDEALAAFITSNLKYPSLAKEHGIEGNINLLLLIEPDGKVGNIKVERMVDPDLEAEAIRIVRLMPAWEPARENDVAVSATVEVVIPFRLD